MMLISITESILKLVYPNRDKAQYFDILAVTIDVTDAGNVIKTVTWTAEEWYHWHRSNSYSTNET